MFPQISITNNNKEIERNQQSNNKAFIPKQVKTNFIKLSEKTLIKLLDKSPEELSLYLYLAIKGDFKRVIETSIRHLGKEFETKNKNKISEALKKINESDDFDIKIKSEANKKTRVFLPKKKQISQKYIPLDKERFLQVFKYGFDVTKAFFVIYILMHLLNTKMKVFTNGEKDKGKEFDSIYISSSELLKFFDLSPNSKKTISRYLEVLTNNNIIIKDTIRGQGHILSLLDQKALTTNTLTEEDFNAWCRERTVFDARGFRGGQFTLVTYFKSPSAFRQFRKSETLTEKEKTGNPLNVVGGGDSSDSDSRKNLEEVRTYIKKPSLKAPNSTVPGANLNLKNKKEEEKEEEKEKVFLNKSSSFSENKTQDKSQEKSQEKAPKPILKSETPKVSTIEKYSIEYWINQRNHLETEFETVLYPMFHQKIDQNRYQTFDADFFIGVNKYKTKVYYQEHSKNDFEIIISSNGYTFNLDDFIKWNNKNYPNTKDRKHIYSASGFKRYFLSKINDSKVNHNLHLKIVVFINHFIRSRENIHDRIKGYNMTIDRVREREKHRKPTNKHDYIMYFKEFNFEKWREISIKLVKDLKRTYSYEQIKTSIDMTPLLYDRIKKYEEEEEEKSRQYRKKLKLELAQTIKEAAIKEKEELEKNSQGESFFKKIE